VNRFYDPLIAQLDLAVAEGFLPPQHRAKVIVCETPEQIFNVIRNLNSPQHIEI
jgi:predicted Rossmann-fold nucleotide-binding protein